MLDNFQLNHDDGTDNISNITVSLGGKEDGRLKQALRDYKFHTSQKSLLFIPFITVNEYLFLLRDISMLLGKQCSRRAIWYLAAAVSDFYIPDDQLSKHKIQSSNGHIDELSAEDDSNPPGKRLTLIMEPVPKVLKPLVETWTHRQGFIVSFKLETDPNLIESKSRAALERYGHNMVIANLLQTRKRAVTLYSIDGDELKRDEITLSEHDIEHGMDIESLIVQKLVAIHRKQMSVAM